MSVKRRTWVLWLVGVALCAAIVAGFVIQLRAKPSPKFTVAEMIRRNEIVMTRLRTQLTAGGFANLPRPQFPTTPPTQAAIDKAMSAPDGERGPLLGFPSFDEVNRWCISRGVFEPTTDEDAVILLRTIDEHPDGGARLRAIFVLPTLLSEGLPLEFMRSNVSDGLKQVIVEKLLALMRDDTQALLQYSAVQDCCTAHLWRFNDIRDEIERYFSLRRDNRDPLFCLLRDNALKDMATTPRGMHFGSTEFGSTEFGSTK